MKFNEKLILLRKQHGYSQEKLAEKIGVSRQAVSRWEAGDTTPEMALLAKICSVFNVSADYLINDTENEKDIPALNATDEEAKPVNDKKRRYVLFSAVCFAFAAFCSLMAIIFSKSDTQLALSCFSETLLLCLSVFQFVRYFKSR